MLDGVSAGLDVRATCASRKARLRHLHRCLLVLDTFLDQLDVFLHVEDLLQNLRTISTIIEHQQRSSVAVRKNIEVLVENNKKYNKVCTVFLKTGSSNSSRCLFLHLPPENFYQNWNSGSLLGRQQ